MRDGECSKKAITLSIFGVVVHIPVIIWGMPSAFTFGIQSVQIPASKYAEKKLEAALTPSGEKILYTCFVCSSLLLFISFAGKLQVLKKIEFAVQ